MMKACDNVVHINYIAVSDEEVFDKLLILENKTVLVRCFLQNCV